MISFFSCKNEDGYTYAIKDFRKLLQPQLSRIVTSGIVMWYDSALHSMATDDELVRLTHSEHPILRAAAFKEICGRKSLNPFDLLAHHLDDTAIVPTDHGEFGIWLRTVSDDILQEATWKTQDEKNNTIELVLTKHNYLRSAYLILLEIEPQEKYYGYIKEMATRPGRLGGNGGFVVDFNDLEHALYGLAKFKKPADIQIIKEEMMENVWKMGYISFRVIKEFPDTAYFDVLKRYYRRQFYKFSGNRRDGFTGIIPDRADPEDFIDALVMLRNDSSARLLDTMLVQLPLRTCMPEKDFIVGELITEIWDHPCPAYTRLREKIKSKAEEISKSVVILSNDSLATRIDTTKEPIRW